MAKEHQENTDDVARTKPSPGMAVWQNSRGTFCASIRRDFKTREEAIEATWQDRDLLEVASREACKTGRKNGLREAADVVSDHFGNVAGGQIAGLINELRGMAQ